MITRRDLVRLAGASASMLWLPRSARSQVRLGHNPFALGVASGSPTAQGVVLWTRLMASTGQGPATVSWEVAHDDGFKRLVRSGQAQAEPALAHSVHVEVAGLEPGRWYYYRFMTGDAVSAVGRTRTLPSPDAVVTRWRMAYASCQKWEDGYFSPWRHMLGENLDAVLFLGDYLYE